ncbi:MAG: PEP-CTERM sorting domain-containing protein [Planctomycetota bacterium]
MTKRTLLAASAAAALAAAPAAALELELFATADEIAGPTGVGSNTYAGFGTVGNEIYGFFSNSAGGTAFVSAGNPTDGFAPVIGNIALTDAGFGDGLSPNFEVLNVGTQLIVPDTLTGQGGLVSIETTTNTVSSYLSTAQINAAAGTSTGTARLIGVTTTPGAILYYFTTGDALYANNLTPGNATELFTASDAAGVLGVSTTDFDGAVATSTTYYAVGTDSDNIVAADLDNNGLPILSTFTEVFSTSEIELIADPTDTSPSLTPREMILGPDGRIYLYEDDSNSLLSFDATNPAGTLRVDITEAQIQAATGGTIISDLGFFGDTLLLSSSFGGGPGLYAVVPEPASLGLLALGGLVLRRRR